LLKRFHCLGKLLDSVGELIERFPLDIPVAHLVLELPDVSLGDAERLLRFNSSW
jgi:hypothetical protein